MTDPRQQAATTTPKIVADFEYEGATWLVVDWPATEESPEPRFEVYRADLPWNWKNQPYEDVRV